MFLEPERWNDAYAEIVRECGGSSEPRPALVVVAATSVDAVCASRIWTYWMRADGILYELLAADHWKVVQERLLTSSTLYGACILLNMGATVNLARLLTAGDDEEDDGQTLPCKIYVIDGRRPIHLANIHDQNNIVVLCDRLGSGAGQDEDDDDDVPSDGDNLSGTESSSDEEDDDEEDDEDLDDDSNDDNNDEGEHEFGDDEQPKGQAGDAHHEAHDMEDDNNSNPEGFPSVNKRKRRLDEDDPLNMTAATIDTALTETATTSMDEDGHDPLLSSTQDTTQEENGNDGANSSSMDGEQVVLPVLTPRELHRHRRERLRRYYARGTYRGSPSSFVSWHMTSQSRFAQTADLLWLAVTGVAGAFWYHELDRHRYETLAGHLQQACELLFPTEQYFRGTGGTVYAEHLLSNNLNDDGTSAMATTRTKIGVSENGRILCEPEFRFFLLRQSSLYQAITQSDYVATTWQVTTPAGRLKLHEWLATLGFALHDCQQPFGLLKPTLRRRLQPLVRETAPEHGLEDLEVPGFFRVTGFQSLLSAADAAHAIAALLALPPAHTSKTMLSSGSTEGDLATDQDHAKVDSSIVQKSFQLAFDALNYQDADPYDISSSSNNNNTMATLVNGNMAGGHTTTGIAGGFRLASQLQHAIQMMAASLIDRKAITRLSHFRYANITCGSNNSGSSQQQGQETEAAKRTKASNSTSDKFHVFAQPMVLTRLAHYLMDWHRASGQWTGANVRPLVLCAQDPRSSSYIVVGQEYPETAGMLVRNRFGQYFAWAAETLNATDSSAGVTVRLDYSMDNHIVQVAESHVQRFIEQLHFLYDSV